MGIDITTNTLDEVKNFIEEYMVDDMNNRNLTVSAMAFIIQTLLDAVKAGKEKLNGN